VSVVCQSQNGDERDPQSRFLFVSGPTEEVKLMVTFHTDIAKRAFDEGKHHIKAQPNKVTEDLLSGLSHLCDALAALHTDVEAVKSELQKLKD